MHLLMELSEFPVQNYNAKVKCHACVSRHPYFDLIEKAAFRRFQHLQEEHVPIEFRISVEKPMKS